MRDQNRVPKGISTAGQFAATTHPESTLVLDPVHRPVTLAPGDCEDFTELADGDVIERLGVSRRNVDDGAGYWVEPSKTLNFKDLITAEDLGGTDEDRDAYLEVNTAVIEDFMATRYGAEMDGGDEGWESVSLTCPTLLPAGPLTEGQVADAAWNNSKIVQLHNESDPGTFGSDYLGRLLREHVGSTTVIKDSFAARVAARQMSGERLDATVAARYAVRALDDATALAVADSLSCEGRHPALRKLSDRGYASTGDLTRELTDAKLANRHAPNIDAKLGERISSLRHWVLRGGDND
ncbi:hypothetical protein ACQCSX_22045 (plasmid) [Pseudarthrobacter sp. P1]|uniref:hypothetical protein n=1 Tax=Pseudarthrobacter sp. P1 TaxID=3418418 RepID=UPI003CF23EC7